MKIKNFKVFFFSFNFFKWKKSFFEKKTLKEKNIVPYFNQHWSLSRVYLGVNWTILKELGKLTL